VKSDVTHSLSYFLSVVLDSSMAGKGKGSMRREDLPSHCHEFFSRGSMRVKQLLFVCLEKDGS